MPMNRQQKLFNKIQKITIKYYTNKKKLIPKKRYHETIDVLFFILIWRLLLRFRSTSPDGSKQQLKDDIKMLLCKGVDYTFENCYNDYLRKKDEIDKRVSNVFV